MPDTNDQRLILTIYVIRNTIYHIHPHLPSPFLGRGIELKQSLIFISLKSGIYILSLFICCFNNIKIPLKF